LHETTACAIIDIYIMSEMTRTIYKKVFLFISPLAYPDLQSAVFARLEDLKPL
jgi:hypothetical protein